MFRWLRSLFSSNPVPPTETADGPYRFDKPATKSQPPKQSTLFAPPAPLPKTQRVEVVRPPIESDSYQWIDYGEPTVIQPTKPAEPPEKPVFKNEQAELESEGSRLGRLASGICSTGANWFITGICMMSGSYRWDEPAPKPAPVYRRNGEPFNEDVPKVEKKQTSNGRNYWTISG
jgi:hypothetical protein